MAPGCASRMSGASGCGQRTTGPCAAPGAQFPRPSGRVLALCGVRAAACCNSRRERLCVCTGACIEALPGGGTHSTTALDGPATCSQQTRTPVRGAAHHANARGDSRRCGYFTGPWGGRSAPQWTRYRRQTGQAVRRFPAIRGPVHHKCEPRDTSSPSPSSRNERLPILSFSGTADLGILHVVTDVPLPATKLAMLVAAAELRNRLGLPVSGTLQVNAPQDPAMPSERGSCWMCRRDQPRRHRVAGQAALSAGAA